MARTKDDHLVVIGASAGGVDALSTLVATLPADFPAPIVVAQHLDPRRASHLHDILGRHAQLPVSTMADREPLKPGTLYVVPSHRHVEIREGAAQLIADGNGRPQPSIDLLLSSAADVYGERLVAVILTGSGSDGSDGARRVKAAGGTVVIQDPATAQFPSMPLSLAPTTVDIVADLESIGPMLVDLVRQPRLHTKGTDGAQLLDDFLEQLRKESGIDFAGYKRPTITRRLHRRITATGSGDLAGYVEHLRAEPAELQRLTSSFLLKVTEFFRDPVLFERLRAEWLPELAADAGRRGEELRVWSAGCATGEEAYSLAMLVAEALDQGDGGGAARIFATDLDDAAIAYARRGVYPVAAFANVPAELRERYVIELDGEAEVTKEVRSLVVFGQHDLGQRAPFPRTDLVLCRNVLIYFQAELQRRALQLFAFSLRSGGLLVLGKAETAAATRGSFEVVDRALKVYRRAGQREALPPVQLSQPARPPQPLMPARRVAPALDLAVLRARREADLRRAMADRADRVLLALRTGIVVVDEHYDISRINAAAREVLSIHGTAVGDDFVHLAVGLPSSEVRAMIDAALRGEPRSATFQTTTTTTETGAGASLEVSTSVIGADGDGGAAVLIELRDVSETETARADLERLLEAAEADAERSRATIADEVAQRVDALEHALAERETRLAEQLERLVRSADTHRQLIAANRELTDTNALLRTSNDELLISNEEVQASTAEVETLNEELQATNEELETLNEELQASIEELNSTNSQLESRTIEIEEANEALSTERTDSERQRQRLSMTMSSMGDAVMMVDEHGAALLTNDSYDGLFADVEADSVLEVGTGESMPSRDALQHRAAAGETFGETFALRAPDGSRRWFEGIGHPLRGEEGERGGVVVIRDITERSMRELQDQFVAMVAHELRTPLTALSGYVELLRRQLGADADERSQRFADRAVSQAQRMTRLVGDLLDASRLQGGGLGYELEPVDLAHLVTEMVEITRPLEADFTFEVSGTSEPVSVIGDVGRLQQVVLNLLSNARHHARSGERVEVALRRRGATVELRVRDHGPGIDEEDLPHLFTRFYQGTGPTTSNAGGLGLGLYITRQIVDALGGTIVARRPRGSGALFVVTLPIADARPAARRSRAPSARRRRTSKSPRARR